MSKNPEPPAPTAVDQPDADQPRRLRVGTLLNTSTLLCTTALLVAVEPKVPPYKGD